MRCQGPCLPHCGVVRARRVLAYAATTLSILVLVHLHARLEGMPPLVSTRFVQSLTPAQRRLSLLSLRTRSLVVAAVLSGIGILLLK